MDAQDLLNQLLQAGKKIAEQGLSQGAELAAKGKELAQSGIDYAKQSLPIPEAGPERDKMLKQLGVGAAAGGLLGLMLGTRSGRRTLARVAKVGSLAAMGVLGYKIYSDYMKDKGQPASDIAKLPEPSQSPTSQNHRCTMIVRAMIAAAKADGTIDERERQSIEERIRNSDLDQGLIDMLMTEIQKPLVVGDVAKLAKTPIDGIDIYLSSLMVIEQPSDAEQRYLAELAKALDLDAALVKRLESEAFNPI